MTYKELTEEQRKRRNKSNAASIARYNAANYDKITLRIRKDGDFTREQLQAAADRARQSVNQWITEAIKEKLK